MLLLRVNVKPATIRKKIINPLLKNLKNLRMLSLLESELSAQGDELNAITHNSESSTQDAYQRICDTMSRIRGVTANEHQPEGHKKLMSDLLQSDPESERA